MSIVACAIPREDPTVVFRDLTRQSLRGMSTMTLPERLRLARGSRTQEEVARAADLGVRLYQTYESGKSRPSYPKLPDLVRALGVTPDYLLGLTDDPHGRLPTLPRPPEPQGPPSRKRRPPETDR